MRLPIGYDNFKEVIDKKLDFVDKTLFIKEIIDDPAKVILINRARRFGKTFNLSILEHFFAKEVTGITTKGLFDNFKIAELPNYMAYQGKYLVINLTFKEMKGKTFESLYKAFSKLISDLYTTHYTLLDKNLLFEQEKIYFQDIIKLQAEPEILKSALADLTMYLFRAYKTPIIILIDEYDSPIQQGYINGFYEDAIELMRSFLSPALKGNANLEKGILTGILRIAKESMFSDLNNLKVYSILNERYSTHFGFTEEEVNILLEKSNLQQKQNEIKNWYNGYRIGKTTIYNPWSIINYIHEQGKLGPYWINTSDNALIKGLLISSTVSFKSQLESLMRQQSLERIINENIVFPYLKTSESALWTLLLMSGYLKAFFIKDTELGPSYQISIPNIEVTGLYRSIIAEWLSGVNDASVFNKVILDLLNGQVEDFAEHLQIIMLQTFSAHDIKGKNPEKFFHGFILGLLAHIDRNAYTIDSNKESGLGRYDIILIPNDTTKLCVIFELKSIDTDNVDRLMEAAELAHKQIDEKQYIQTALQRHVKECLKIGAAFGGKLLRLKYSQEYIK